MTTAIQKPVDFPWSVVHAGVGFGAGALRLNPWIYGGAIVLYEIVENSGGASFRKSIFGASLPETELNSIADIGLGLMGYAWGRWLRERRT